MPYIGGKSVTQEELYKQEKWETKHASLTKTANIIAMILLIMIMLAGIIGIGCMLVCLITSDETGYQIIGWSSAAVLTLMILLSLFFTRFEI